MIALGVAFGFGALVHYGVIDKTLGGGLMWLCIALAMIFGARRRRVEAEGQA